jgi:hypothetical protein
MTMNSKDGRAVAREREVQILRALHRFGFLRTKDLAALIWQRWASNAPPGGPSLKPPVATETGLRMAQRTLRRMRHERLVLNTQAPDGSIVYALSEAGARALQGLGVRAITGKDQVRSFSTSHFRHRCIANEVAISAIIEGYRASTEREISQGLWLGGKKGIAGKLPDVFLRSGSAAFWVEVERSRKHAKDHARLRSAIEAFKNDALRQSGSVLLGDKLSWGKVVFICPPAFRVKLCRELEAAGWSKKDIASLLKFEMLLYSFKDIAFS